MSDCPYCDPAVPWEEWVSRETSLRRALEDATLVDVEAQRHEYLVRRSGTDYLTLREAAIEGLLLRRMIDEERWHEFRRRVADAFRRALGGAVEYRRAAYLGV